MAAAMDCTGNPSSVHAEGRAALGFIERARAQIAQAVGSGEADIVFVSGASEAAALALAGRGLACSDLEHEAVRAWATGGLSADGLGAVQVENPAGATLQLANSECGVVQNLPTGLAVSDITQGFGKLPFAYSWGGVEMVFLSAHKFGGPKGAGALIIPRGYELNAQMRGGGQELGRRAGTENVAAIAGMGAAAEAAMQDLANGVWDEVRDKRDHFEAALQDAAPDTVLIAQGAPRLPHVSCFSAPGWKGETQVMAMDLAGYAVSAGSACSSGKVRSSKALLALGYDAAIASSALRVSLGRDTKTEELLGFVQAWSEKRGRALARRA